MISTMKTVKDWQDMLSNFNPDDSVCINIDGEILDVGFYDMKAEAFEGEQCEYNISHGISRWVDVILSINCKKNNEYFGV